MLLLKTSGGKENRNKEKQDTTMKERVGCRNNDFYTKINKCRNLNKSIISLYLYNGETLL